MKISANEKFVLIGDSITDAVRDESGEYTPWNSDASYGRGYVNLLHALIHTEYPDIAIRMVNRGVSGNTIKDLEERWQNDVLDLEPDWLSVCIGVNDVWRQYDSPKRPDMHVTIETYERIYEVLLAKTRSTLKGLILITPFVLEPNREDAMRATMDRYGQVVAKMAEKYDALFVDSQAALDELMKHVHPCNLAWDRIHMNSVGHMALAKAMLEVLR